MALLSLPSRSRLSDIAPLLVGRAAVVLAALAAGVAFAYYHCFSQFMYYDDQGYLMLYLRNVLEGRPHYRYPAMLDPYGPWYYLVRCIPHGLLGIPLTTDGVRLLSVFFQVACSLMLGLAVWVLRAGRSGGVALAVACFASCVCQLQAFANEPGHAQEVIVVAITLGAFLAAAWSPRPFALCLIVGCMTGIVLASKLNVGVFLALGVALALGGHGPPTWFWMAARSLALAVACGLPALMLRGCLADVTRAALAVVVPAAVVGVWLTARSLAPRIVWESRHLLGGLAGVAVSLAAGVGFMWWQGTDPWPVIHSIVVLPMTFAAAMQKPRLPLGPPEMLAAVASLAAAGVHAGLARRGQPAWLAWIVVALKAVLAVLAVRVAFSAPAMWQAAVLNLKWGPALLWVVLVPLPGQTFAARERLWRELICFVAALQVLQIFPVVGSQVSIGTLLLVPAGVLCLGDLLDGWQRAWAGRAWGVVPWGALAAAAVVGLFLSARVERNRYRAGDPLRAAGAERMRLPEPDAAIYQWLIDNARQSPETFVCTTTPHSLHFWTERRPLTLAVTGHGWAVFPEAMQRNLMALYGSRPDVLAVDFDWPWRHPSWKKNVPFYQSFCAEYVPLGRADRWTLYTHRRTGRSWSLLGCSYAGPAVEALFADIHEAQPGRYAPLPAELDLVLTAEQATAAVTALQVIDLRNGRVLADSRNPSRPAWLTDARGTRLLPATDAATPGLAGRDGESLRIRLAAEASEPPAFPVVRFFDAAGRRLFTLVIAMTRSAAADADDRLTGPNGDH